MARPKVERQIEAAAVAAGWAYENPVAGVVLLRRPDVDPVGGPLLHGRELTLLVVRRRERLTAVQEWFRAACDDEFAVFVVTAAGVPLLRCVLAAATSDEAARAEVELERAGALLTGGEPVAEWNGPNAHGQRVRQSSRR